MFFLLVSLLLLRYNISIMSENVNCQIKILSDIMIHKISAGEVIERPLSIVKELVENSIDARAKSITVEIKNGGLNFIRVTDNGIGIDKSQIPLAFTNHATSKLNSIDDFESLMTLGFRGEALCTIAAVSQVEMTTKTANAILGSNIKIHGGNIIEQKDVSCLQGTTIIAQNIFYNTPARLKFLKRPAIEASYISNIMNRFALSNPQICFKFISNGKIIFTTNGNGDLQSALMYIMGKDIAKNVLKVHCQNDKFKLTGYIVKPEFSRSSRSHQNFFINGRYVKNNIVSTAIENAYRNRIMVGQFPVYVLNLEVDPGFVDVNVHPSKMEIRFANDDLVYDFVFSAISDTFKNAPSEILISKPNLEQKIFHAKAFPDFEQNKNFELENKLAEAKPEFKIDSPAPIKKESLEQVSFEKTSLAQEFTVDYKIVGSIFNIYWLIEKEDKIYIMDQHAAHERILFEQIKTQYETGKVFMQQLMMPIELDLNEHDAKILLDNTEQIKNLGFDITNAHEKKFIIRGVPHDLNQYITKEFFMDLLETFEEIDHGDKNKMENVMQMACKKAVKAHDNLSYPEIKELIKKIMQMQNPFNCPHGRPTFVEISKYEIEKLFGRKK